MPDEATDGSDDGETFDVRRRPVLGSLGTLGVAGSLGLGVGPGQTVALTDEDGDWESTANDRIEKHRKADLEVKVTDADGNDLDDAEVDVAMKDHEYDFGAMIHAEFLTEGTQWGGPMTAPDGTEFDEDDQQEYAETVEDLFNTVVLENLHKWGQWEDNKEIADNAVDWAIERDMDVRGHVALWGNVGAHAIPADVVEAMGVEWEDGGATDPEHDPEYVVERSMDHIEEIITHYGDDVKEWEIKNEVLHETAMINAVEGDGADDDSVDPATAEILGDWYEHAEEVADEEGVGIAVNDYNTLAGPHEETREDYERQIDYLVNERGIDLDGIGFQSHFAAGETLTPDEILDGLDYYDGYGAGFRATEFDTFQEWDEEWEDPEEKGEFLYTFLKTFFSHPGTDSFLIWGHWDGVHWGPDMGFDPDGVLFDQDWNPKPAHDYYTDLVFEEWWTEETGKTDGGVYKTRGFKGEYEITASDGDATETTTATLTDGGETIELKLDADDTNGDDDGDGDGDDTDGSTGDDSGAETDDGGDGSDDGDDSVPGLGIGSALAALSGLAGYALLRDDDEA